MYLRSFGCETACVLEETRPCDDLTSSAERSQPMVSAFLWLTSGFGREHALNTCVWHICHYIYSTISPNHSMALRGFACATTLKVMSESVAIFWDYGMCHTRIPCITVSVTLTISCRELCIACARTVIHDCEQNTGIGTSVRQRKDVQGVLRMP